MLSTHQPTITVDNLRAILERHDPVTVLDVRPTADWAEWAIPGSIHVDAYERLKGGDPNALADLVLPADVPVVTLCGAGKVSLVAAEQLRARGFDVRSLAGGMKAWSLAWNVAELPLPVSETEIVQIRRTGKGCLSYLIGSEGEAAVIDPALDPRVYLDLASRYGWVITHVLETHVHADHLTRARTLVARSGAILHVPATDRIDYPIAPLHDGDVIDIGTGTLRAISTPGHTPESMSYLLDGEALFTGDTLFLAGVGRPDLEASAEQARERAHLLFRSLRTLMALPPRTIVLPGHTSAPVGFDREPLRATLGEIRERVAMLKLDEPSFVDTILARIPPTPPNHQRIVELNEAGILPDGDPTDLEAGANRCAVA